MERDVTCGWEKKSELGRGRRAGLWPLWAAGSIGNGLGGPPGLLGPRGGATPLGLTADRASLRPQGRPGPARDFGPPFSELGIWDRPLLLLLRGCPEMRWSIAVTLCRPSGRAGWRPRAAPVTQGFPQSIPDRISGPQRPQPRLPSLGFFPPTGHFPVPDPAG